jgi:protein-disulfide isomerase
MSGDERPGEPEEPKKPGGPGKPRKQPGKRVPSKNERARAAAAKRLAAQRAAERRRRAVLASAIAVAVLAVVAFVGVTVYLTGRPSGSDKNVALPRGATSGAVTVGVRGAPVTVDIYLDYQCPICKEFESETGATLQKYVDDGAAKIAYHPVAYLDRFSSGTKYSTRSSAASGCAADEGKFTEFTNALYANQPEEKGTGLTNERMVQLGRTAELSSDAFAKCVTDQKYEQWTELITDTASKDGVSGTPTVKVAGKTIDNPTSDAVSAAIDKAASAK